MLHDVLTRLETLQEEMNNIREELVDTLKESFDLESLKLTEEDVKPLNKFGGDDSEEEQEEEFTGLGKDKLIPDYSDKKWMVKHNNNYIFLLPKNKDDNGQVWNLNPKLGASTTVDKIIKYVKLMDQALRSGNQDAENSFYIKNRLDDAEASEGVDTLLGFREQKDGKQENFDAADDSEEEQQEERKLGHNGQTLSISPTNIELLKKALFNLKDPKDKQQLQAYIDSLAAKNEEDETDEATKSELENDPNAEETEEEYPADDSEEEQQEAIEGDADVANEGDEEENSDMPDENSDASGQVNEPNASEECDSDEDGEEGSDEDNDEEDNDEDEKEVDEESDQKKNSESPSSFDKIKTGDKFKLPKIDQTFRKISEKEYTPDHDDPKVQQKNKSVIINPKSKVISVPKVDTVEPSPTESPASTPGESEEKPNAGTQTSQDTKTKTSNDAAKPVKPVLEESDNKSKSNKRVVDLTGRAATSGTTKADVDKHQLAKGKSIEMEHTKDASLAEKIALDHLSEIPDYYDRLERMEREASTVKGDEKAPAEKPEPEAAPEEPVQDEVPNETPTEEPDVETPTDETPDETSDEEPESEQDPAAKKEKKQLKESTLDNLVNGMIISALENIEKAKG